MGRKKYIDKIVTCSHCGKNVEEILEKSGIGIKPSNMRKLRNTGQSD